MKKSALSIIALSLLAPAALSAQVRWLNPTFNFGAFSEDLGEVTAEFLMVNDSPKSVRILDARATCGCTQPEVPNTSFEPGDTARIRVTYLAEGRPGRFSKNVYIKTSDDRSVQHTLVIEGTVIGSSATLTSRYPVDAGVMRLSTSTLGYGEIFRGKLKSLFVQGYNVTGDTLVPEVRDLPPYISCTVVPDSVPPGEQVQFVFSIQTSKIPEWGINSANFSIVPDAGAEPVEMESFAIVTEDFSKLTPQQRLDAPVAAIDPQRVNLGEIAADSAPRTVEFKITNSGKSPLLIRRIQAVDPSISDVKLQSDKIKPGKSAKLTLVFTPSAAESDFVNARVSLITNDPDNSLIVARLTAELTR